MHLISIYRFHLVYVTSVTSLDLTLNARVKIVSYLHYAFLESKDINEFAHMRRFLRLISVSAIQSAYTFYLFSVFIVL